MVLVITEPLEWIVFIILGLNDKVMEKKVILFFKQVTCKWHKKVKPKSKQSHSNKIYKIIICKLKWLFMKFIGIVAPSWSQKFRKLTFSYTEVDSEPHQTFKLKSPSIIAKGLKRCI